MFVQVVFQAIYKLFAALASPLFFNFSVFYDGHFIWILAVAFKPLSDCWITLNVILIVMLLIFVNGRIRFLMLHQINFCRSLIQIKLRSARWNSSLRGIIVIWRTRRIILCLLALDVLIDTFLHLPWKWHASFVFYLLLQLIYLIFIFWARLNLLNWRSWKSRERC